MHRQYTLPFVPFTQVELTCQQCGIRYQVHKRRLSQSRFCSQPCLWASRRKQVAVICEMCGASFSVPLSRHARGELRFCSATCYDADRCIPIAARLLRRGVRQPNGCLFWPAQSGNGYARITIDGRIEGVHVVAYRTWVGPIPDGQQVHHLCDIEYAPGDITYRQCFEPSHLTTGTNQENLAHASEVGRIAQGDRHGFALHPERWARGADHWTATQPERVARGDGHGWRLHPESVPRGELNGEAKLTADDVIAIRARVAGGEQAASVARLYGISKSQMSRIVRRQSWRHI